MVAAADDTRKPLCHPSDNKVSGEVVTLQAFTGPPPLQAFFSVVQLQQYVLQMTLKQSEPSGKPPVSLEITPEAEQRLEELPTDALEAVSAQLEILSVSSTCLCRLPENLSQFQRLKRLALSNNQLTAVPGSVCALRSLEDLDLSRNGLVELPVSIGQLVKLRYLNVMRNHLTLLPASLGNLTGLQRLGVKDNRLTHLPESIGLLASLVELFLTGNQLKALPESLGGMTALVKLQASFNALQSLPTSISRLQRLELMRVAVNSIQKVPKELARLDRLAWFSLGGNPACAGAAPPLRVPALDGLSQLTLGTPLGEGASGDVAAAEWQGSPVAVKVFRADTSPDGRAVDEVSVAACLDHPNLIRVRASVQHPAALVVDRVFGRPLAAKPTHDSLLRCRWAPDTRFSPSRALTILLGVARALEHLHSLGICHGDMYAHNVLADDAGRAVLCDYGASFFYHCETTCFQQQEVRAFGLFLADVEARLDSSSSDYGHVHTGLMPLLDLCLCTGAGLRPSFSNIAEHLTRLQTSASIEV